MIVKRTEVLSLAFVQTPRTSSSLGHMAPLPMLLVVVVVVGVVARRMVSVAKVVGAVAAASCVRCHTAVARMAATTTTATAVTAAATTTTTCAAAIAAVTRASARSLRTFALVATASTAQTVAGWVRRVEDLIEFVETLEDGNAARSPQHELHVELGLERVRQVSAAATVAAAGACELLLAQMQVVAAVLGAAAFAERLLIVAANAHVTRGHVRGRTTVVALENVEEAVQVFADGIVDRLVGEFTFAGKVAQFVCCEAAFALFDAHVEDSVAHWRQWREHEAVDILGSSSVSTSCARSARFFRVRKALELMRRHVLVRCSLLTC